MAEEKYEDYAIQGLYFNKEWYLVKAIVARNQNEADTYFAEFMKNEAKKEKEFSDFRLEKLESEQCWWHDDFYISDGYGSENFPRER